MLSLLALLFAGCPETVEECGVQRPVPDTTVYEWVKVAWGGVCAGDPDGFVHCWGGAQNCEMTDVPYRAFDAGWGAACGITVEGDNRCWGWSGWPEPLAEADIAPKGSGYDQVAMARWGACWLKEGEPPVCLPDPLCEQYGVDDPATCTPPPMGALSVLFEGGDIEYCGLDKAGTLVCWGADPPFQALDLSRVVKVDADEGPHSACAIDANGLAWCGWRLDEPFSAPRPIVDVALGTHTLFLDDEGGLTEHHSGADQEFSLDCDPGEGPYIAIGSGESVACAVPPEGGLRCWLDWDGPCVEFDAMTADWGHLTDTGG